MRATKNPTAELGHTFSDPELPGVLTTLHSSSSYGVPVYVVNGEAYGPHDLLPTEEGDPLAWIRERVEIHLLCFCRRRRIRPPLVEAFLGRSIGPFPGESLDDESAG